MEGHVVVDERRRLPGRGAWLHPEPGCLTKAERRRAFPRALRVPGSLDVQGLREHPRLRAEAQRTATNASGAGSTPAPDRNQEAGRPVMSQP
ncbi:YlxR family protein [Amycolatopsis sp. H20-H5]|uniref:YlxR family protein n=1 Tax=Amycolatopsis sp. H20-H5 TaxID=3046309 RepID=UPI002DBAA1DC|nr:YlxR family protein [Amycolatopsis sp. H20-H5]MEC3977481.1 YlxR family protein [Amycolatopsis sp. H20-H5]